MSFNSEFIYTGHSDTLGPEDLESMLFSYEYGLGCGFEAVTYNEPSTSMPHELNYNTDADMTPMFNHYIPPSAISTKYYTLQDPNAATHEILPFGNTFSSPVIEEPTPTWLISPSPEVVLSSPPCHVPPEHRRNKVDIGGALFPSAQSPEVAIAQAPILIPSLLPLTNSIPQPATATPFDRPPQQAQSPPTPDMVLPQLDRSTRDEHAYYLYSPQADASGVCDSPAKEILSPHIPAPDVQPAASQHHNFDITRSMLVYSPTTARRIPVSMSPTGARLQYPGVTGVAEERTRHKRLTSTPTACAFCKRRKIACGGPLPSDEARRCGQCILRKQCCEFPVLAGPPQHGDRTRASAGRAIT